MEHPVYIEHLVKMHKFILHPIQFRCICEDSEVHRSMGKGTNPDFQCLNDSISLLTKLGQTALNNLTSLKRVGTRCAVVIDKKIRL
jgi:hypothetical protein